MRIVKPPESPSIDKKRYHIFLAGSIELGAAEDWQKEMEKSLADSEISDFLTVFNPRRDNWDWKTPQTIDSPLFKEQVEWELEALEKCDLVFINFCRDTKSPISLLEFGLFANTPKMMLVHCPEGFWRKGNVDIVCQRYGVFQASSIDDAIEEIVDIAKLSRYS